MHLTDFHQEDADTILVRLCGCVDSTISRGCPHIPQSSAEGEQMLMQTLAKHFPQMPITPIANAGRPQRLPCNTLSQWEHTEHKHCKLFALERKSTKLPKRGIK